MVVSVWRTRPEAEQHAALWKDGDAAGLTPLAVQSAGAAVMAASFGMATASYMTGAMFGVFQGMMESSMRSAGAMTPTAPTAKKVVKKAAAKAKDAIETGADVVPMEAAKAAEKTVEKAADAGLATVAKIKSDAKEAAAAAREATDTAVKEAEKTAETLTTALEPEDFLFFGQASKLLRKIKNSHTAGC